MTTNINVRGLVHAVHEAVTPRKDQLIIVGMPEQCGVRKFNTLCEWKLFPGDDACFFEMHALVWNNALHHILVLPGNRLIAYHALAEEVGTVELDEIDLNVYILLANLTEEELATPGSMQDIRAREDREMDRFLANLNVSPKKR